MGNRDAQFYLRIGAPTPTPQALAAVESYIERYKGELRPDLRGSVYLNFMMGNEARQRAQDAYPPSSYQRLLELKAKYDPENMFLLQLPASRAGVDSRVTRRQGDRRQGDRR